MNVCCMKFENIFDLLKFKSNISVSFDKILNSHRFCSLRIAFSNCIELHVEYHWLLLVCHLLKIWKSTIMPFKNKFKPHNNTHNCLQIVRNSWWTHLNNKTLELSHWNQCLTWTCVNKTKSFKFYLTQCKQTNQIDSGARHNG